MAPAERPISTVLNDIVGDVQEIVRSELTLAKTEVREELGKSRSGAILLGIGVLMGIFGALFVLLAAVYALSTVLPAWAAALIVGVGEAAVAGLLVSIAVRRLKTVRAAPRTVASLKENVAWARQQMK